MSYDIKTLLKVGSAKKIFPALVLTITGGIVFLLFEDYLFETIKGFLSDHSILHYDTIGINRKVLTAACFLVIAYYLIRSIIYRWETRLFILLLTVIYIRFRIQYETELITLVEPLFWSDILLLIPVYFLLNFPLVKYGLQRGVINKNKGFSLDRPIPYDESASASELAESLLTVISNTYDNQSAFAIAINGSWGSGKSSFLEILRSELRKKGLVIDFKPWQVEDAGLIQKEFFNNFSIALGNKHYGIKHDIRRYTANILNASKLGGVQSFLLRVLNIHSADSANASFERIKDGLLDIKESVYVIIDDIDRLNADEILQVLKLIRSSADFGNVIFIAAFDLKHVINALDKKMEDMGENYLKKIFQVQIEVVKLTDDKVKQKLLDICKGFLDDDDYAWLSSTQAYLGINQELNNVRDAIRLGNELKVQYPLFMDKTYFPDFFNLMLLKYRYLAVYQLLRDDKKYFLIPENYDSFTETARLDKIREPDSYYPETKYVLSYRVEHPWDKSEGENNPIIEEDGRHRVSKDPFDEPILELELKKFYSIEEVARIMQIVRRLLHHENEYGVKNVPTQTSNVKLKDKKYLSIKYVRKYYGYFDIGNLGITHSEFMRLYESTEIEWKSLFHKYSKSYPLMQELIFRIKRIDFFTDYKEFERTIAIIAQIASAEKWNQVYTHVNLIEERVDRLWKQNGTGELRKEFDQKFEKFIFDNLENRAVLIYLGRLYDFPSRDELLKGNKSIEQLEAYRMNHSVIRNIIQAYFTDPTKFKYSKKIVDDYYFKLTFLMFYYERDIKFKELFKSELVAIKRDVIGSNLNDYILRLVLVLTHRIQTHGIEIELQPHLFLLFDHDLEALQRFIEKHKENSKYSEELLRIIDSKSYNALLPKLSANFLKALSTIVKFDYYKGGHFGK